MRPTMASRVPTLQCLQCLRATQPFPASRAFSTTVARQTQTAPVPKRRRHDPYAAEQAKARRAANLSRQQVLEKERAERLGDPVRGIETPFVRSFDDPTGQGSWEGHNFSLEKGQLETALSRSKGLWEGEDFLASTGSLDGASSSSKSMSASSQTHANPLSAGLFSIQDSPEVRKQKVTEANDTAIEALRRITNLKLGGAKNRSKTNVKRCIEEFGRHNTDAILPPKPGAQPLSEEQQAFQQPRAGKDTGSSEVQVAILTAKIREAATNLALRGNKDKRNKRNLRLMVHRRQKLLRYLRRKERGGPRWLHLTEKLGLTEGTWKGEISLPR